MGYFLAIENDNRILENYGLAFAYINHIEELLNIFLYNNHYSNVTSKTLGNKIKILEDGKLSFKNSDLLKKLKRLNQVRRKLAHGISSSAGKKGPEIRFENKRYNLNNLTRNAIKLGKDVAEILLNENIGNITMVKSTER